MGTWTGDVGWSASWKMSYMCTGFILGKEIIFCMTCGSVGRWLTYGSWCCCWFTGQLIVTGSSCQWYGSWMVLSTCHRPHIGCPDFWLSQVLPLLFIGVTQLWAYGSGGHETQTQSALIVDSDNIYSLRLCQRRTLQRTLQEDPANMNRILLERRGLYNIHIKKQTFNKIKMSPIVTYNLKASIIQLNYNSRCLI